MTRRVVVTGMGCISALGHGLAESWERISKGEGAIRPAASPPSADGRFSGPAAGIDRPLPAIDWSGAASRRPGLIDPASTFALAATVEALDAAGLRDHGVLDQRTAVVIGCGSGGNATIDAAFQRLYGEGRARVHPQTIPGSMISAPASHIAMLLGIHGPAMVVSSACASSAHALGEAMHMVRGGRVDVAIAGGTEACLTPGSLVAWNALGVLAPDTCRPFSRNRAGMVLGEGAAIVVLEAEEHARARGATILGELAGYGATSDATDITAPDQVGVEAAIRAAHRDAGVDPALAALISAHGTGTKLNDPVEAAALRAVYSSALDNKIVIATKSAHGHLIGATAALEFILGMKALIEGVAPPVLNCTDPDPECALPLALIPTEIAHDVLVSNSFAFGGLNAVLIGRTRI